MAVGDRVYVATKQQLDNLSGIGRTTETVKGNADALATHKADTLSYKTIKLNKDAEGIFTTVEHRRKSDNTLIRKAVLSGGTSPLYTTRTITHYKLDGITVEKTDTFTLSYDADGILISEV